MNNKNFIAQATQGTSYFDGIEIMLSYDQGYIHHRHFYYDSDGIKHTHRIATSEIKYDKPSWSDDDEPYFMRYGRREYLANYMRIGA